MTIPCIIVPILNRPELLDKMLASIDHPVERVIVIDNGACIDTSLGGRAVMPFKVNVVRLPHNIGVAASWNAALKASPLSPWWLIVNSDIEFGAGDLARMEAMVEPRANAVYYMLGMTSFAVTPPALRAVGWFDENFVLGYDEDLDWQRRARLVGTQEVECGFTGTHVGSATIMSDPALRAWNGFSHGKNDEYYSRKWGGPKQGGETFTTPFSRGGHVGEWHLDINRLRDQIWPRTR